MKEAKRTVSPPTLKQTLMDILLLRAITGRTRTEAQLAHQLNIPKDTVNTLITDLITQGRITIVMEGRRKMRFTLREDDRPMMERIYQEPPPPPPPAPPEDGDGYPAKTDS